MEDQMWLSSDAIADLKVKSFIAGFTILYDTIVENPHFIQVPIEKLDTIRKELKLLKKRFIVRYRGPRYDRTRQTCLKRNARNFTVYFHTK